MAFEDQALNPDPSSGIDPSQGRYGLRLFKSSNEAYQQDVAPRVAQASPRTLADALGMPSAKPQESSSPRTLADVLGLPQQAGPTNAPRTLADVLGLNQAPAPTPAPEQGNFSRGLSVSGKQLKQTLYGTAALVGDTVGADSLKDWGLKGYKDAEKEVRAISKDTDSFTTAVEKGELGKWFSYSSGYLIGQVAEMGAASLAGAAVGSLAAPGAGTAAGAVTGAIEKGAVQAGVRSFVGKMIDKQAAEGAERLVKAGVAKEIAEKTALESATKSVYRTIGATTANTFLNATQELGSIYGDAVQEALDKGQDYSLGRVWLAGIAATAVDSWADSKALGKFVGAFGGDKKIRGIAMEALKGGFREGMTEGVQTAIERWGADKDLTSKEAFKDYIDSAAVGILGGGVAGGVSGGINKVFSPDTTKGGDRGAGQQDLSAETQDVDRTATLPRKLQTLSQRELMDTLANPDAMAYLYSKSDEQQKKSIDDALMRAGTDYRERFDQVVGREDNIRAGQALFAENPVFEDAVRSAIGKFASTLNVNQTGRRVARPRKMTEQEQLDQLDEANQALYGDLSKTPPMAPAPMGAVNATPEVPADVNIGVAAPPKPPAQASEALSTPEVSVKRDGMTVSRTGYAINFSFDQPVKAGDLSVDAVAILEDRTRFAAQSSRSGGVKVLVDEGFLEVDATDAQRFARIAKGDGSNPSSRDERLIRQALGDKVVDAFFSAPSGNVQATVSQAIVGRDLSTEAKSISQEFDKKYGGESTTAPRVSPNQRNLNNVQLTEQNRFALEAFFGDEFSAVAGKTGKTAEARRQTLRQQMAKVGFTPEEIDRVSVATSEVQQAKEQLKDAAAEAVDIWAEAAGGKLNITGRRRTYADLAPALAKVMDALVKLGYVKFKDIVRELMKRMRASKEWGPLADQVTPAMLKQAYINLKNFPGKESADMVRGTTRDELKNAIDEIEDVNQEVKRVELEIAAENEKLNAKYGKNNKTWSKAEFPASDVPAVMASIEKDIARLEELQAKLKELTDEQRAEQKLARPRKEDKVEDVADDAVDYGVYKSKAKEDKPKAQKPNRPQQIAPSRLTPTLREHVASIPQKDQGAMLVRLGQMTDAELKDFEAKVEESKKRKAKRKSEPDGIKQFREKIDSIIGMKDQVGLYRKTLQEMRKRLAEIENALSGGRTIEANNRTYKAVDETDENAYLWGDRGFRTAKDLPQDKLLAVRRGLIDDIREMQIKSLRGQAALLLRSLSRIEYDLSIARTQALRDGLPMEEVDAIFNPARESIVAMMKMSDPRKSNKIAQDAARDMRDLTDADVRRMLKVEQKDFSAAQEIAAEVVDETDFNVDSAIDSLIADIKSKKVDAAGAFAYAARGMREGLFTFGQLVEGMRRSGVDLSREMLSVSGEPAMQRRMVEYVNANGGSPVYREAYLASMDRVLAVNPGSRSLFTEAELTALELRNERLQEIRDRRIKDDVMLLSNDAEDAFKGLLFTKYSLSQMRNPETIPERERMALQGTITDLPRAWFQDVYFALKTRPTLADQVIGEEGMIAPTEVEQYRQWVERHERAIDKEAEVTAKLPYYQQLARLDGLTDEQFERMRTRIARAKLDEMDKIMGMAKLMNDRAISPKVTDSELELMLADFQEQLLAAEESGNNDIELTYDGTMGTEAERSRVADDQRDFGLETQEVSEAGPSLAEEEGDFDAEGSNMLGLDDDGTRLRTATKSFFSGVMTAGQVQAHVARITSKWSSAPKITVVQDATMLPEPLRSRVLEKLDPTMDAKGVFDSETGEVFLFSNAITGEADTEFTLFHEVYGHLGLRAFLGPKFDQFLENMYRVYPGIRGQVDELVKTGMPKLEAIDEVISDRAAANAPISVFKGWVGRVIAGLREIGLNRVADWMGKVTDAELSFYLKGAREAAQNGGYPVHSGAPGVVRFKQAQHERLYEMFSIKDGKTTGYARFNPVTQTWAVFKADKDDIRKGYSSMVVPEYEQVLDMMRKSGKVEFRKRSGAYVEDKLPGDMPNLVEITNVTGMKRWMRNLITQYQNEFKPIFDVVDRLRQMGRLTERMDVKTALMLYERKTGAIIDIFRRKYVSPIEKLIKEAGDQGADYGTINTFLLARHAEERNKQIARINKAMPDKGSGMYTEDAREFLKSIENAPYRQTLEEIGRLTDQMSQEKLKYLLNTGMITAKQYQAMQVYKRYVNLSGQNNKLDKFEDISHLVGRKFGGKGKEARAYGRSDPASDILANTILGMESALIRGQKNMVAQKLLAMLEANYDPNFATVNEIAYKRQIGEDGMVMEVEDTDYITRKDVMVAKVNGIPVTIRFKDTTPGSFAEAIHGAVYPPQSGDLVEAVGKFNQIMGQMLTTWNPAWVAINFVRDTQTLFFNAASDGRITRAQAAQMVKMLPKAIKTAYYMAMVESGRKTNINPDPELVRAYNEMKRAGGLTSFLNRKDLESQVGEIEKALGDRTKLQKAGDKVKSLLDIMEFMTLPAEIAPRLAAYKVVRDGGFTQDQAAVFSGEITVNFNMRGANKSFRKLYLFFNPAIQGSAKLATVIRDNPQRAAMYVTAWIGLGAMVNLIGRALSDDDEDGRNEIDKVPVYKRATSMVLKPDTPFGAIPIAYGWNAFYSLGHFALDTALGIQPPAESAKRIAKTAIEAFSPLGTAGLDSKSFAGTVLKGAAPTVLLPMVEFVMNENRYGAPIRMSDQFGAPKPDSEMAFRSVSPISKAIAQGLNELTRGNRARPGDIDINPSTIDFMINSYLPGLINEAYKGASVAARVARGEEVKNVPMPVIDRFSAKIPEGFDAGAFRRAKEMIDQRFAEYKAFPEKRDEIRQESPGLMRAHAMTASATQQIRKLRSMLTDYENNPNVSSEEKVRRLNMVREKEKQIYNRAVKAVMEAGPEFREAVMASD